MTIFYRKLQDRVDKLEAGKESLVNHIYDLRQLLQKINADGESKILYLKGKNLQMKQEIAQLLKALEISRTNATHFANVASYWGKCVNTNSYKAKSTLFSDHDDDDCDLDHHLNSLKAVKVASTVSVSSAKSW